MPGGYSIVIAIHFANSESSSQQQSRVLRGGTQRTGQVLGGLESSSSHHPRARQLLTLPHGGERSQGSGPSVRNRTAWPLGKGAVGFALGPEYASLPEALDLSAPLTSHQDLSFLFLLRIFLSVPPQVTNL